MVLTGGVVGTFGFGGHSGGAGVPTRSLAFVAGSSKYLDMFYLDFGTFDRAKFAISAHVKRSSIIANPGSGARHPICGARVVTVAPTYSLKFDSSDRLVFTTSSDNATETGKLVTTQTYTSTSAWLHIYVKYDSANATANNRMRMWVNGTEISAFDTRINPTTQIGAISGNVGIGTDGTGSNGYFDGNICQPAIFSTTLPAIEDVYFGGMADITLVQGLYSLLNTTAAGSFVNDYVLVPDWANNNGVTRSASVPS